MNPNNSSDIYLRIAQACAVSLDQRHWVRVVSAAKLPRGTRFALSDYPDSKPIAPQPHLLTTPALSDE